VCKGFSRGKEGLQWDVDLGALEIEFRTKLEKILTEEMLCRDVPL
jgi:hypothetical protein